MSAGQSYADRPNDLPGKSGQLESRNLLLTPAELASHHVLELAPPYWKKTRERRASGEARCQRLPAACCSRRTCELLLTAIVHDDYRGCPSSSATGLTDRTDTHLVADRLGQANGSAQAPWNRNRIRSARRVSDVNRAGMYAGPRCGRRGRSGRSVSSGGRTAG
jgi:hypothetical protein